jgi:hypothetical protein
MKKTPEELLDICLEMARRGEDWRAFLPTYPSHSAEVGSLVVLALEVEKAAGSPDAPAPGASAALLRMGRELARREQKREESAHRGWGWMWGSAWAKAAFAGVVMFLLGASAIELSARTVPGNFLYPVKILTERVRFALTSDPEERVELRLTFSERRLAEVVKTLKGGDGADKELIAAMLGEAQAALADTAKLPEGKSAAYKARVAALENVQKTRIRAVEGSVLPEHRQRVEQAARMCDDGWIRMREMMCGPQSRGSGREPRRGMGGMMMGPGNDWCR